MPFVSHHSSVHVRDRGHLGWVLEDVRKSLNYATNVVRRLIRDPKNGSDVSARNHSDLHMAQRLVNQSAVVLEMVGHQQPARLVFAMGRWIQNLESSTDTLTEEAATVHEAASRAILDYLDGQLKGGLSSPVALFVQYRAIVQLAGVDRTHPADLWQGVGRWDDIKIALPARSIPAAAVARSQLDKSLLSILRHFDVENAGRMADLCAELAGSGSSAPVQTFWWIATAFFEALRLGELPNDVYVRRTAARIIPAYALAAEGQISALSGLAHELLFYCAFAPASATEARAVVALREVKKVFGLERFVRLDYQSASFGRFDAAQLAQLRKLIGFAAEGWSALSGGDVERASAVVAQFAEMGAAVMQLNPQNEALVSALLTAVDSPRRLAKAPSPAVAIEVATAILYLEIAFDDLDQATHTMEQQSLRLAARLQHVAAGGDPLPIEGWMEALYRRVGDRKMMGTVVGELAHSLAEIERSVDCFVRDPSECSVLQSVPVALGHMRGVFSVLGLSQAALASLRMCSTVECLLAPEGTAPETAKKLTLQLVNSLSAMGFLIDMLRYQPAMAKELFEYDENACEFRLSMEREQGLENTEKFSQVQAFGVDDAPKSDQYAPAEFANRAVPLNDQSHALTVARDHSDSLKADSADVEIQDIFLSEACDVVDDGAAAIADLALAPSNLSALTRLRRAFHTLKGSARMVGFPDFGEAAWAFEQLLNARIEGKNPVNTIFLGVCEDAINALKAWIESISLHQASNFKSDDFRLCADAMRLENRRIGLPGLHAVVVDEPGLSPWEVSNAIPRSSPEPERPPKLVAPSLYQGTERDTDGVSGPKVHFITIGNLTLRLDFFEVFINEASAWAAQLQSEIENWKAPVSQESVRRAAGLAHAIQGSAAAVGFDGLAALSQSLDKALEHLDLHAVAVTDEKVLLCEAVHDMSRLMDAFGSGVLAEPSAAILAALEHLFDASAPELLVMTPTALEPLLVTLPITPEDALETNTESAPNTLPGETKEHALVALPAPVAEPFDTHDVLDQDLLPIFFEEGQELLQGLSNNLHRWISEPQEVQSRIQALRILHTLKGSARLAGAMRLGELAHRMESSVETITAERRSNGAEFNALLKNLEHMEAIFGELSAIVDQKAVEQYVILPPATESGAEGALVNGPATASVTPLRTATSSSIRVRAQVLDRLIDQAGEVMTSRTRMEQRLGHLNTSLSELGRNLHRLRHQLRDLEINTELQMRSRQSQLPEVSSFFDPLELDRFTGLQEVTRMMAESVADVDALHKGLQNEVDAAQEDVLGQGRRAKELTHGLLRMRLVEFESIADRLYGVVRQTAKETGKQVRLDIEGGSIEIDRGALDRMTPSFEHILRNAVVHGIEPSEIRAAAGKSETGSICISVQQDGSDVAVRFVDDGAGLQIEKIRAKAVEAKLLEASQSLDYEQAAKLLFVPGFSTADSVSELAGRGIGMDVVLSDVSAIGGRIETSGHVDGGTSFQVVFPLTTAVTQIVLLRMDNVTIGVPANLLETVLRIPQDQMKHAYATGVLRQAPGQEIPFFWVGAIVGVSTRVYREYPGARQQSVAVIRSAGQRVSLHVDEVLGNREVVVKNLGMQLSQLPGLVGISVLASGAVVLIYNPVALVNVYGESIRDAQDSANAKQRTFSTGQPPGSDEVTNNSPLVLVVDDSITVRRVTQRLLSRAGFRVTLASDGIQALELIRDERPALVLSDIEMPRMDGLELTRQIRADAQLSDLPIIIITSRTGQKHRDHAAALGVNHYLGKPYGETELLDLVRTLSSVALFS